MFHVYADGVSIYHPAEESLKLLSPKLTLEVGKAGSLSFQIPPSNRYYDSLRQLKTVITVKFDDVEIFRGRVLTNNKAFNTIRNVYCEGTGKPILDEHGNPIWKKAENSLFVTTGEMTSKLQQYAKTELLDDYWTKETAIELESKVDEIAAGLSTLVRKTDNQGWQLAEATTRLYASMDDVKAEISAMVIRDAQGNTRTMAQILADQIALNSKLTSADGSITADKMWAKTSMSIGLGGLTCAGPLNLGGKIYSEKSITSTSGTVYTVLAS